MMMTELFLFHARIQEGDRGSRPPLRNYKNIGFLTNTGPDHLKKSQLPSQPSMLGHHQPTSERPFKWRFAGGADDGGGSVGVDSLFIVSPIVGGFYVSSMFCCAVLCIHSSFAIILMRKCLSWLLFFVFLTRPTAT